MESGETFCPVCTNEITDRSQATAVGKALLHNVCLKNKELEAAQEHMVLTFLCMDKGPMQVKVTHA